MALQVCGLCVSQRAVRKPAGDDLQVHAWRS